MAGEKTLGRLPKWPRKALSNSVIAAEQAFRTRSGLPLLTEEDMEALKAGVQLPWEGTDGGGVSSTQAPDASRAAAPVATATAVAAPPAAGFSPEVEKWLAAGKKWSKSAIAAEQARRKRNSLPPLTDAEVLALLGEPAGPAPAAPPAAAATSAAPPRPQQLRPQQNQCCLPFRRWPARDRQRNTLALQRWVRRKRRRPED